MTPDPYNVILWSFWVWLQEQASTLKVPLIDPEGNRISGEGDEWIFWEPGPFREGLTTAGKQRVFATFTIRCCGLDYTMRSDRTTNPDLRRRPYKIWEALYAGMREREITIFADEDKSEIITSADPIIRTVRQRSRSTDTKIPRSVTVVEAEIELHLTL